MIILWFGVHHDSLLWMDAGWCITNSIVHSIAHSIPFKLIELVQSWFRIVSTCFVFESFVFTQCSVHFQWSQFTTSCCSSMSWKLNPINPISQSFNKSIRLFNSIFLQEQNSHTATLICIKSNHLAKLCFKHFKSANVFAVCKCHCVCYGFALRHIIPSPIVHRKLRYIIRSMRITHLQNLWSIHGRICVSIMQERSHEVLGGIKSVFHLKEINMERDDIFFLFFFPHWFGYTDTSTEWSCDKKDCGAKHPLRVFLSAQTTAQQALDKGLDLVLGFDLGLNLDSHLFHSHLAVAYASKSDKQSLQTAKTILEQGVFTGAPK